MKAEPDPIPPQAAPKLPVETREAETPPDELSEDTTALTPSRTDDAIQTDDALPFPRTDAPASSEQVDSNPSAAAVPPPGFDLVRVDAQGGALVAGTAPPFWNISVEVDGSEAARGQSDRAGNFAALFDLAPSTRARVIFLVARGPSGEEVRSTSSVIIAPRPPEVLASAPDLVGPDGIPNDAFDLGQAAPGSAPDLPRSGPEGPAVAAFGELPLVGGSVSRQIGLEMVGEAATPTDVHDNAVTLDPTESAPPIEALERETAGVDGDPAQALASSSAVQSLPPEDLTAAADMTTAAQPLDPQPLTVSEPPSLVPERPLSPQPDSGMTAVTEARPETGAPPEAMAAETASVRQIQAERVATGKVGEAAPGDTLRPQAPVAIGTGPARTDRVPASGSAELAEVTVDRLTAAPLASSSVSPAEGASAANIATPGGAAVSAAVPDRAPSVLLSDASGVRLFQPARTSPASGDRVAIEVISYDDAGGVLLEGRSKKPPPVAREVRVYLDNAPVQRVDIAEDGSWRTPLSRVETGVYTLRVDQVDVTGQVISRFETPFKREDPGSLSALAQTEPGEVSASVITVQPGYTLWGIASDRYGSGINYVQIFEANRSQIRDPDLIYPGQVFDLPSDPG